MLSTVSYLFHHSVVIMSAMASQITSLTIVWSTVYSGSLKETSKFRVTGLCAGNSPVTGEFPAQRARRKMFPFDDVIKSVFIHPCVETGIFQPNNVSDE